MQRTKVHAQTGPTKRAVPDNEQKTHRQTHAYISTGAEKYYSGKQSEFTPRTTEKVSYMNRTSTNRNDEATLPFTHTMNVQLWKETSLTLWTTEMSLEDKAK